MSGVGGVRLASVGIPPAIIQLASQMFGSHYQYLHKQHALCVFYMFSVSTSLYNVIFTLPQRAKFMQILDPGQASIHPLLSELFEPNKDWLSAKVPRFY